MRSPFVRLLALLALVGFPARSNPPPKSRVLPIFSISKSENKNEVQYAVHLDERCQPAGAAPIFAYWRMLEKGPSVTEPLLPQELDAYGIASQAPTRTGENVAVRLVLRAVRGRPIVVEATRRASGECEAVATVAISGKPAHLYDVYAKLKWPFGVEYLLLEGWSEDGTRVIREKLAQ
jgi:hypothetical protein